MVMILLLCLLAAAPAAAFGPGFYTQAFTLVPTSQPLNFVSSSADNVGVSLQASVPANSAVRVTVTTQPGGTLRGAFTNPITASDRLPTTRVDEGAVSTVSLVALAPPPIEGGDGNHTLFVESDFVGGHPASLSFTFDLLDDSSAPASVPFLQQSELLFVPADGTVTLDITSLPAIAEAVDNEAVAVLAEQVQGNVSLSANWPATAAVSSAVGTNAVMLRVPTAGSPDSFTLAITSPGTPSLLRVRSILTRDPRDITIAAAIANYTMAGQVLNGGDWMVFQVQLDALQAVQVYLLDEDFGKATLYARRGTLSGAFRRDAASYTDSGWGHAALHRNLDGETTTYTFGIRASSTTAFTLHVNVAPDGLRLIDAQSPFAVQPHSGRMRVFAIRCDAGAHAVVSLLGSHDVGIPGVMQLYGALSMPVNPSRASAWEYAITANPFTDVQHDVSQLVLSAPSSSPVTYLYIGVNNDNNIGYTLLAEVLPADTLATSVIAPGSAVHFNMYNRILYYVAPAAAGSVMRITLEQEEGEAMELWATTDPPEDAALPSSYDFQLPVGGQPLELSTPMASRTLHMAIFNKGSPGSVPQGIISVTQPLGIVETLNGLSTRTATADDDGYVVMNAIMPGASGRYEITARRLTDKAKPIAMHGSFDANVPRLIATAYQLSVNGESGSAVLQVPSNPPDYMKLLIEVDAAAEVEVTLTAIKKPTAAAETRNRFDEPAEMAGLILFIIVVFGIIGFVMWYRRGAKKASKRTDDWMVDMGDKYTPLAER